MKPVLSILVVVIGFSALGYLTAKHFDDIADALLPVDVVYQHQPDWFRQDMVFIPLSWEALIPEGERDILNRYQVNNESEAQDFTSQVFKSIQSAKDQDYQQALISTNTVPQLEGEHIHISGYIVPIDFYPNRDVKNLFVVPYFGACIHYPPPPPNQMIFVQLEQGFSGFDINQAYTLNGKFNIELFEDFLGTSAYSMDVNKIIAFTGEPDQFRDHSS